MLHTYKAILLKDRVQWRDEAPPHAEPVEVHVTVLTPSGPDVNGTRGKAMAAALEQLAARGGLGGVADGSQWQRDVREDRPLPGRE